MSNLNQVSGGNCRLTMYRETSPNIVDPTDNGIILSMMSETMSVNPNKQNSAVITGKRGSGKPYEGLPEYTGGVVLASYAPQLGHILRALCGAPTTTTDIDITLTGDVTDEGQGYVGLPCTNNTFIQDSIINISNTTNYDGDYLVEYGTNATKIVIKKFYVAETLADGVASRGRSVDDVFYKHEFVLPKKQPSVTFEKYLDFDSGAAENPYIVFSFCKVNGINFAFGGGNEVSINLDVSVGASESKSIPVTLEEGTLLPAVPFMDKEFAVWVNNERTADIQSGNIDLQFGIEPQIAVGNRGKRSKQPEGDPVCTCTLSAFLEHDKYNILSNNSSTIPFTLSASGAQGEEFRVNFPESEITASGAQITGKQGLNQDLTVTSFVDQAEAGVSFTLINRIASYA